MIQAETGKLGLVVQPIHIYYGTSLHHHSPLGIVSHLLLISAMGVDTRVFCCDIKRGQTKTYNLDLFAEWD